MNAAAPPPRVAFLGPRGTFTEEALLSQRDLAEGELAPIRSIGEVVAEVEAGRADLGIVPIENSIEGSVNLTLDVLAAGVDGLHVQREVVLAVALNLCARPGTTLADVTTVASMPHATAQCRGWLARTLPGAALTATNSTAEAAEAVARSKAAGRAAISTTLSARLYGLDVLAADVEDHPENETRFVVLGRGVPPRTGHDKTSIVVFQNQDRPGSLLGILSEFATRAVNLTKLESRPTKRGLGSYCFFIDCEGHIGDEVVADVLRALAAVHTVKFLGSYPLAGPGAGARRRAAGRAWRAASEWVEDLRAQIRTA